MNVNEKKLDAHYGRMHNIPWDKANFNDYRRLKTLIHESDVKSVVEIGCGTGWWYNNYGQYLDIEYIGLDISEVAIKICKEKFPSVDFRHWVMYDDITKEKNYLSSKSSTVSDIRSDLTFSRHVYIHNEDVRSFIQNTLDFSDIVLHIGNYKIGDTERLVDEGRSRGVVSNSGIHGSYQGFSTPRVLQHDNKYSKTSLLAAAEHDNWNSSIQENWLIMEKK